MGKYSISKVTMEELLRDCKREIEEIAGSENNVDRILHFYSTDKFKYFQNEINDLEKEIYNKNLYQKLKWENKKGDYDVISSFWTTFCCALYVANIGTTCNDFGILGKAWNKSPFLLGDGNFKVFYKKKDEDKPDYHFMTKQVLAQKILNSRTIYSKVYQKYLASNLKYCDFAEMTHCVANFMPCPEQPYNSVKGIHPQVCDYFPLMVDLIEKCSNENQGVTYSDKYGCHTIGANTVKEWKGWLLKNRTEYCLEDYYYI